MASFLDNILLRITGDDDDAKQALASTAEGLAALAGTEAEATVSIDTAKAKAEIQAIKAALESISDEDVDIDVRRGAIERLGQLGAQLGDVGEDFADVGGSATEAGEGIFSFVTRISPLSVALAAVLAPALISAGGAVVALGAALTSAALGAAALGTAGLASFLGATLPLITRVVTRFEEMKDVSGSAANRASEAFKELGRVFDDTLAPAADHVLDGLAAGVDEIAPTIPKLRDNFTDLGKAVEKSFGELGERLADKGFQKDLQEIIDGTTEMAGPIADGIAALAELFGKIASEAMPELVDFVKDAVKGLEDLADVDPKELGKGIETMADDLDRVIDFAGDLGGLLINVFEGALPAGRDLIDFLDEAVEGFNKFADTPEGAAAIERFFTDTATVAKAMADAFGLALDAITGFFDFVRAQGAKLAPFVDQLNVVREMAGMEPIPNVFKELGEGAESATPNIDAMVEAMGESVGAAQKTEKAMKKAGQAIGKAFGDGLKDTKNEARKKGRELGDESAKGAEDKKKDHESAGRKLGGGIKDGLAAMANDVRGKGRDVGEQGAKGAEDKRSAAEGAGQSIGKAIGDGVKKGEGDARSAGKAVGEAAQGAAKGVDGSAAGAAIGASIASGIRSKTGDAAAAGRALGEAATKAFNAANKSKSPSGVYREAAGNIIDGLVLGLQEGTPKVIAEIDGIASRMNATATLQLGVGDIPSSRARRSVGAGGGNTVVNNFNSLSPGTPEIQRAAAAATTRGIALQRPRPRKRISV